MLPSTFLSFPVEGKGGSQFQMVVVTDNRPQYDQHVFETGFYSELATLFVQLLRGEGTLIDLGANIGNVCLPVAATGTRVVAVEMLPANVLKLTLAGLINHLYGSRESLTLFRPPDPAIHLGLPATGIAIVFREAYNIAVANSMSDQANLSRNTS